MKITVIGAGAIGNLVAGYLKLKNEDVSLIGHSETLAAIRSSGIHIRGARGDFQVSIDITERLTYKPDLVILTTKTQDIEAALTENLTFLKESTILTTQNGIHADEIASSFLSPENIVSSIVMFGSTYLKPAEVVHNFEGSWIIGRPWGEVDEKVTIVAGVVNKIFPVVKSSDIRAMKYLKIFVNASNCIPAILGVSMQEAFQDLEVAQASIGIWQEGLEIVKKAGINLVSLPDFPLERLTKLVSLPNFEAAKILSGIMTNLSKEPLYGSILQSIHRNRASEVDYINGEFLTLAKDNGLEAALNTRLVALVHEVERTKRFLSKKEFLDNVREVAGV